MKYNHLDMLPIRAFKPRSGSRLTSFSGGGMTLEGGGGGFISDIVESVTSPFEAIGEAVSDVAQTISDVGVQVDKSVGDAVPGGWATVGAVVATVVTLGAASELLVADLALEGAMAAEVAADAAMAAETAGALEAGIEAATVGAEFAAEAGTAAAAAEGASTAIAVEAGTTAAEVVGAGAEIAGEGTAWAAEVAATQEAAAQAALQQAAQNAGIGALKGAGMNALSSAVQGRDITPEGLLKGAATGAVGAGIGSLASNSLADYGSTISKMGGSLAGGLAGGTTGAALNGGDIGQGIVSGGLSGLAGATSIGAGAGLQDIGLDPTSSRFLANTALGAGKAALGGGDAMTGGLNAAIGTGIGMGTNMAGNAIVNTGKDIYNSGSDYLKSLVAEQTPEEKLTQLASSGTMSDASLSPLEETVGRMGSVKVSGAPEMTPEEEQYNRQLIEALYPNVAVQGTEGAIQSEKDALTTPQDLTNIDATGNVYDKSGAVVSSAVELGLIKGTDSSGSDVWITQNGDFIPVTTENQTSASDFATQISTPSSNTFGTGPSEAASDNPQEIINNNDGSVTIIENDGTERTFNVDGSVTIIGADGKGSEEYAKPVAEEKAASSGTSTLGNIAGSLLGAAATSAIGGGTGGKLPNWVPGMAAIGAGVAAGVSNDGTPVNQYNYNPYGFDWGQQGVNQVNEGVAYGQKFFDPTYTKKAAQGGLMSIPNTVQPTVGQEGFKDPTASVQMYAQGGSIDHETMQIVKHLKNGGATMQNITGFLDYRKKKMAQGGSLGSYSDGGRLLKGMGDGMSDDIPASIAGVQPARLANEEFVIPADVVSHLGNGSSEAGSKVLYDMLDKVRKARTGHTKQGKQINPDKLMPKARK
jgi:hypothetical protein